jgi:hypothetical protein
MIAIRHTLLAALCFASGLLLAIAACPLKT